MRTLSAVLSVMLAAGACWTPPAAAAPRAGRPRFRKATKPQATPGAQAPEAGVAPEAPIVIETLPTRRGGEPASESLLAAFGAPLAQGDDGVKVLSVAPGSAADGLGLRPGDLLLSLGGAPAASPKDAASALAAWPQEARIGAVVMRGLDVLRLDSPIPEVPVLKGRVVGEASPQEAGLRERHLEAASAKSEEVVRNMPAPRFRIQTRQTLWIRFLNGLPPEPAEGAVLEGETVTPLTVDLNLDYLIIPPHSAVWAKVVSAGAQADAATVRLHVFKLRLKGGHTYQVSARVSDVSGDHVITRVSPGGTVVSAAAPSGKPLTLLPPDTRYKLEFLEPVVLFEGPRFYLAGPGLWFKAKVRQGRHGLEAVYEVTQVVPNRAAAVAGIKAGDEATHVDGADLRKLDFPSAIERLYGPPGSIVSVRVRPAGAERDEPFKLVRGARYENSLGLTAEATGSSVRIVDVAADSPAQKAGLRPGDSIVQFGSLPVSDIPQAKVLKLLQGDLVEENSILVRRGDKPAFEAALRRGPVLTPIPPPYKP